MQSRQSAIEAAGDVGRAKRRITFCNLANILYARIYEQRNAY